MHNNALILSSFKQHLFFLLIKIKDPLEKVAQTGRMSA